MGWSVTSRWNSCANGLLLSPESFSGGSGGGGLHPSIRPSVPSLGQPVVVNAAAAVDPLAPPVTHKIQAFEQRTGVKNSEASWKRTPNTDGHGATHCRTFHCRLSDDAFAFLDQAVNEWLDAHPQYEVKFVSTSVGQFQGKLGSENHLIMQCWV